METNSVASTTQYAAIDSYSSINTNSFSSPNTCHVPATSNSPSSNTNSTKESPLSSERPDDRQDNDLEGLNELLQNYLDKRNEADVMNSKKKEKREKKEKKGTNKAKGTKRVVDVQCFYAESAWKNFENWCCGNTHSYSIHWINNEDTLEAVKSYYEPNSEVFAEDEDVPQNMLHYPRFATISCLFDDGMTSMRWSKKVLAARFSSERHSQRFPAAMGYMLSLAYVDELSELFWKHNVFSLYGEDKTYTSACWRFLFDILRADGWSLKTKGPLICFNMQETIRPVLQKFEKLASSINDLLDPCIMGWLLQPDASEDCMNIQYLMARYLPTASKELHLSFPEYLSEFTSSAYWENCCIDSEYVSQLVLSQRNDIEQSHLTDVLVNQEIPTAALLSLLEINGVPFDASVLMDHADKLQSELHRLEIEVQKLAGKPFSLNSPQQLAKVLFEWLQLPIPPIHFSKKLRTAHISTNDEVLQSLVDLHPIIPLLQRFRGISKLYSTYIEQLKPLSYCIDSPHDTINGRIRDHDFSKRIYTRWRHTMTVTGRLSSSNPNLQNIPHKQKFDELGEINCRNAFVCQNFNAHVLLSVDYCQIEMRILAHFCGKGRLKGFFSKCNGGFVEEGDVDIYKEMAASFSKLSDTSLVSDTLRKQAKITCLALIYGSGVQMLSKQMETTVQEASKFRSDFLAFFPEVSVLLKSIVETARHYEYVTTLQGRRRYLPEINASDISKRSEAERFAVNTKIQGSASDLMKISMLKVQNQFHKRRWNHSTPKILLTLHDEMLLECHKEDVMEVSHILKQCMTVHHGLSVPLSINLKKGHRWGMMETLFIFDNGRNPQPKDSSDINASIFSQSELMSL